MICWSRIKVEVECFVLLKVELKLNLEWICPNFKKINISRSKISLIASVQFKIVPATATSAATAWSAIVLSVQNANMKYVPNLFPAVWRAADWPSAFHIWGRRFRCRGGLRSRLGWDGRWPLRCPRAPWTPRTPRKSTGIQPQQRLPLVPTRGKGGGWKREIFHRNSYLK